MRIHLINSNTSAAVTAKITEEASKFASKGTVITGVNAAFGPEIISTRTEVAISTHGLIDACARYADQMDAMIVGMSLDAGVWAAREMLSVPVIGMSEAALHLASLHGNRLGLFVFGGITQPYREMAEAYGFGGKIGAIEALGITPKQHLENPTWVEDRIVKRIADLAAEDQIDTAILVGAVAAGLPKALEDRLPIPTFEGISCAVVMIEAMARLGVNRPSMGSFVPPRARNSAGLGDALAAKLKESD